MNDENLVPNSERTPIERRENARKAGIASGVARRNKKALRQTAELLLSLPLKRGKVTKEEKLKAMEDLSKGNPDAATLIIAKQIQMAIKGNTKSVELIAKLLGDEPKEEPRIEETSQTSFIDDLEAQLSQRKIEGVDDDATADSN